MLKNKFALPTISRSKASRAIRNFGHPCLQGALHRAEWFTYSSAMCLCRPWRSNSRWSHASMVERCSEWMGPCPHSHVTQLHHPISLKRAYHHFLCLNYSWFELFGPLDLRRASLHHDWKNWGSHDWELKRFLQVNPRDPTFEVWRQWRTPSATCLNPSTVSVSICEAVPYWLRILPQHLRIGCYYYCFGGVGLIYFFAFSRTLVFFSPLLVAKARNSRHDA